MNFWNLLFLGKQNFYHKTNWYEALFAKVVGAGRKLIAKFLKIKGNTIVWNQIVRNGNFTSASNWTASSGTSGSVANNVYTLTATADNQYANLYQTSFNGTASVGDKFLFSCYITSSRALTKFRFAISSGLSYQYTSNTTVSANTRTRVVQIMTITTANTYNILRVYPNHEGTIVAGDTFKIENVFCINLTKAFGSGKEPTVEEFTKLYSLPYYQYEQGKLLSFNGTGIKTVGFNQWDEEWETGTLNSSTGLPISSSNQIRSKNYNPCISGLEYYFRSSKTEGGSQNIYYFAVFFYDSDKNFVSRAYTNRHTFTVPVNASYFKFTSNSSGVVYGNEYLNDICVNISDSSKNGIYEPYVTNTASIPVSTYFPTGVKSTPSNYDELTETAAITRVGERAYQSGDESDPAVYTDGTTTYYDLADEVVQTINIDLSFKAYAGGTEQLLPVNGAEPVTSPILADIKYPDGERDDQYFTYRQYLPNSRMMSMALNTILGRSVSTEHTQEALDILMKGE